MLITVVTVANVAVGADAGTVKQWRRFETSEREAGPLVCRDELTAQMQRSGFDAELLTAHGPGAS